MSLFSTTGATESTGGKYINFDGVSSKGRTSESVTYTFDVNTIQFWFNPTRNPGNGSWIVSGGDIFSFQYWDWCFIIQNSNTFEASGSAGNGTTVTRSLSQMPLNNWYFVTIIRNNGTANPLQLQIDEGTPSTGTRGTTGSTVGKIIRINANGNGGCKFGQIICYNRALNSSEISQNYNFYKSKYKPT